MKITAGVLITAIITLTISKYSSDISLLLTVMVCCMTIIAAASYLKPTIQFLERLGSIGNIDSEIVRILLKTAGIGLVSHIACMICTDSGNQSLGKALQFITTVVILHVCIPLLENVLTILETVLGSV